VILLNRRIHSLGGFSRRRVQAALCQKVARGSSEKQTPNGKGKIEEKGTWDVKRCPWTRKTPGGMEVCWYGPGWARDVRVAIKRGRNLGKKGTLGNCQVCISSSNHQELPGTPRGACCLARLRMNYTRGCRADLTGGHLVRRRNFRKEVEGSGAFTTWKKIPGNNLSSPAGGQLSEELRRAVGRSGICEWGHLLRLKAPSCCQRNSTGGYRGSQKLPLKSRGHRVKNTGGKQGSPV